eukprot:GSChrysophyteH2.ASY1.ANO1.511.1 assembled CDS
MLERSFVTKNFQCALDFMVAAGAVAESRGHHPDLHLTSYRNVRVVVYSHGLSALTGTQSWAVGLFLCLSVCLTAFIFLALLRPF